MPGLKAVQKQLRNCLPGHLLVFTAYAHNIPWRLMKSVTNPFM